MIARVAKVARKSGVSSDTPGKRIAKVARVAKVAKIKRRVSPVTSLAFFGRLNWIDNTPLLDGVEAYRRDIFSRALDTYDDSGTPSYNLVVSGRSKKNGKSADLIFAGLYCLLIREITAR